MVLNDSDSSFTRDLHSSGSWNLSPFVIDDKGLGDYTWLQAVLQPWCSGSGTINNPYVIENVTIDSAESGHCLYIRDSNVYFTIRNCSFLNAGSLGMNSGIRMQNTNHGKIINNYFYHNEISLRLGNCSYNLLEGNNLKSSHNLAIDIVSGSNFNEIIDNDIDNNDCGIRFIKRENNTIKGNRISFCSSSWGIYCEDSIYNFFFNNTINSGSNIGFGMNGCSYNVIDGNTFSYNANLGVWLSSENRYNIFSNNDISNNLVDGMKMEGGNNRFNTFHSNIFSANVERGMIISSTSTSCLVYNNSFIANGLHLLDGGSGTSYNNSQIGNYWDNYTGSDFNDDGIGDISHVITSGREDLLPIQRF